LAWPITAIILVALFRTRVEDLLGRLIELKFGKLTVKLDGATELLKQAREGLHPPRVDLPLAEERLVEPPAKRPSSLQIVRENRGPVELEATAAGPKNDLAEFRAEPDPSIQFETAWQKLNRELLQKARAAGARQVRNADSAVVHLVEGRLLSQQFLSAFVQVQAVYKAAKRHATSPIAPRLAREFAYTCDRLMEHLAQVGG
jgi:hypothetical protein